MENCTEVPKQVIGGCFGPFEKKDDKPTSKRSRRFVFTYFPQNCTEVDFFDSEEMSYCYYGIETCPTTGKIHYQGWCIFFNPKTERAVCKKYNCYMRIMKGSFEDNYKYSSKDKNVKEFGEPPQQGKRNDLSDQVKCILEKKTNIKCILENDPMMYHKYGRTLEKVQNLVYKKRTEKPIVHWYYGATGVGKTKKATSINPDYYFYNTETKWWDGYTQQHTIILDDIRHDTFKLQTLLRLLDHYEYAGEIKGGFININSPYIIITSDEGPHRWWQGNDLKQIKRRIDLLVYFDDNGNEHIM